MRSPRVMLVALLGLLMLYLTVNALAHDLGYYSENRVGVVRAALIPMAIGIALLLAALAISRRSRAGYVLGLTTAALMILGGGWVVATEIGYISRGDNAAQWAPVVLVVVGTWIAVWALYLRSIRHARAAFAPAWQPGDRRFAIVLVALLASTTAAHVAFGVVESADARAGVANRALAEKLTQGTSVAVQATNVTVGAPTAAGGPSPVQSMRLELSVHSLATYELVAVPTLCLTDLATARDPTYKPDTYCWGLAGRGITLDAGFPRLVIDDGTVTFNLDVHRADSLCAFGSGRWMAELRLAPRVVTADGSPAPLEAFSVLGSFLVLANGESMPDDPSAPTTDCIASGQ